MSMAQQDQFGARLKRINAGKTTAWTVPGEGLATRGQEVRMASGTKLTARRAKKGGLFALFMAPLSAALAVVAGHWVAHTYLGPEGLVPQDYLELAGPFLSAHAVALVLSGLFILIFDLTTKLRLVLHLAVFATLLLNEHELVRLAPEIYSALYPADWVAEMSARPSQLAF